MDNNFLRERINDIILQQIDPVELIKRYDRAKKERMPWEQKWQLIQDQVFPDYRNYVNRAETQQQPQTSKIKNHSGIVSGKINKIVALLSSQLMDPAVKWMDLTSVIKGLTYNEYAAEWIFYCKEALYDLFSDPDSNFYPSTFDFHLDWYALGNGCRNIILRKDNGNIQFSTISMQNVYAEQSGYGDLSIIYRAFHLTAKQAYDLWGENIHPRQLRLVQNSRGEPGTFKKFEYVEISMPNPAYGIPLPHGEILPTLEYLTCVLDKTNKSIVDIATHHHSPYVLSRFLVAPNETYGRSYVWNAMPDIVSINRISKRILQGVDFAIFPVNLVKDETSITQSQITPGAFIAGLDYNGNPTIRQLPPFANPQVGIEFYNLKANELDDELAAREIFPAESSNMTATEINERRIQANNRVRPLLVRLEHEDLNKTVRRTLSLLEQKGKLPPFPYEKLQISPEEMPNPLDSLQVHFSGQMARMQKLQDIVNSDALFQKILQAAQVDPSVLDRMNLDALIVEEAKIYGISPAIMNKEEQVQSIRQQRAQVEEQRLQMQNESATIDNLVKLKEIGIDPGSIAQG
jgi:hypothetical protein